MARRLFEGLSADRLRELADAGAEVTLNRLCVEIIAIERAFPELAPKHQRAMRRSVQGYLHDSDGG